MIRESIECFIPVIQNQTEKVVLNYLLNNTFSSEYYTKDRPNFSLSRVEFLDIETLEDSPSSLLGRSLFSTNTNSTALVRDVLFINNRILLEVNYNSAVYFNNQEDLVTVVEYPGQSEITVKLVYRYFRKPKQLVNNNILTNRLNILKQNKNYLITELREKFYEFNNVIVIIVNKITQRKEVYYIQEDNRTALLL